MAKSQQMDFGEPSYWEARYAFEIDKRVHFKYFDWYVRFDVVYNYIEGIISTSPFRNQKILVLGVGRSNIIKTLYKNGHHDITAIDVSPTIINEMQAEHSSYTGVEFAVMDVRELGALQDNTYTMVIDKGCIDALFCSTNSKQSVEQAVTGIYRVTKMEGTFASFSYAPKIARVPYFRCANFAIDGIPVIGGGEHLIMYALMKTEDEELIARALAGAEAGIQRKATNVISAFDQKMNKVSSTRSKGNAGSMTITTDAYTLMEMVDNVSAES